VITVHEDAATAFKVSRLSAASTDSCAQTYTAAYNELDNKASALKKQGRVDKSELAMLDRLYNVRPASSLRKRPHLLQTTSAGCTEVSIFYTVATPTNGLY
jgi:hypothetical protein